MIHIDIDNKAQNITLLLKSNKVTPWDYANSQTEYELKKIRQAQEQLKRVKQEELFQQKQRKIRQQRLTKQENVQQVTRKTPQTNYYKSNKDDGLEL